MEHYAGLDISLEEASVCVMDTAGSVVWRGSVACEGASIVSALAAHAPSLQRVVLETGLLSNWLWHELRRLGVPVVCVDARHARAVLSVRIMKTDANDAESLAQLARIGWYREVRVNSEASQWLRSLLLARERLVRVRRDLSNQIRSFLRHYGLRLGKVTGRNFERRVRDLAADNPALQELVAGLLRARAAVGAELAALDKRVIALAREDRVCRLLMTVPGVGVLTALAYRAAVDDPARFTRASRVGAYLGLVPRLHESGEVSRSGRISKTGDGLARALLYEAANVLLTRVRQPSALRDWGRRLATRIGAKKAKVATARKLAVILHCMWRDGTAFDATAGAAA
ncbi:MAG: IS110 family transposase [Alphaproteobacteria bacterium]|nr:IS110 family transposase [Alphaproteobacteria bacterium]